MFGSSAKPLLPGVGLPVESLGTFTHSYRLYTVSGLCFSKLKQMWCTTEGSPGSISIEVIQVSPLNGVGKAISSHSRTSLGATSCGGSSMTISGCTLQPPLGHAIGGGAALGSPSGAPVSAHLASVAISSCFSERSLAKWPASANQGGICFSITAVLIAFAQGRASL